MLPHSRDTVVNLGISAWTECQLSACFPALKLFWLLVCPFHPVHAPNPFAVLTLAPVLPRR